MLLLTGKELNVIASELLKLSLYTGTKPTIDENDVEIIVDDYTEANIFSVIDHILSGQIDKAAKEWEQNLLSGTPASEAAIVKMLSDAFRAALQAAETASLPGEYRNMLSLSREFSALASKSDFRSNQRKKEIKIQVSRLYSKKAAQENGYSNLQGAAMSIFEKSESRVLMAFITADTYKTNGIAPMIEYLWEAEKTIKMGTGVKDTAVPILLGKSLDLLKKIRQGH
jgi:DNA polymerase III delta subunit